MGVNAGFTAGSARRLLAERELLANPPRQTLRRLIRAGYARSPAQLGLYTWRQLVLF